MKKIVIILSFFISACSFGQNTTVYAIRKNTDNTLDTFYTGNIIKAIIYNKQGDSVCPTLESYIGQFEPDYPNGFAFYAKFPDGIYRNFIPFSQNTEKVRWDSVVSKPSAVTNLSGTNSGDNAVNSTYTNDYRAANFVAGTNYLAPNGNGSLLTGLNKSQVGLGNVDNTSDANKPVSSATQTALNSKQATLVSATNIKTINGASVLGSGDLVVGGAAAWGSITGTLSNQSDLQTALGLKQDASSAFDGNYNSLTNKPTIPTNTNELVNGAGFLTELTTGSGSIGYTAGNGGTATQNGNKSNSVTVNKLSGQITMTNSALAAAAEVSFTVNNSTVASTDVVIANIQSVGTVGSYFITVSAIANGSFTITIGNVSTGSLSQALVINFIVIKGVAN